MNLEWLGRRGADGGQRVRNLRGLTPDLLERFAIGPDTEKFGADSVIGGGDEHEVVLHDGTDRVDGVVGEGLEPVAEVDFAIRRVHGDEALTHHAENVAPAMNRGGYGRRVAGGLLEPGPLVRVLASPTGGYDSLPVGFAHVFPNRLSRGGIERDDAGIRLAAQHHDELVAFENRCAADAEERVGHIPVLRRVAFPEELAALEIEADQFAFGAEGVTAALGEQRRAARAVVVAEGIDEPARVGVTPDRFSRGGEEGFHDLFVGDAMMQHE